MEENSLLVLGASSQAGMELIRKISGNYSKILAHYSKGQEKINMLISELGDKIIPVQANLCDTASVNALNNYIKESGIYPDHVVHMASPKCHNTRFHQTDTNEFDTMIKCSVTAFIETIRPIVKNMSKNKNGKIVVMLTAYTDNIPPKYLTPYITAKYALLGLVKALAVEYADKGICVNAVSPQMMDTDFLSEIPKIAIDQIAEQNPMHRLLNVEEVVPTFEYLLSSAADRVTGQNILITGVK